MGKPKLLTGDDLIGLGYEPSKLFGEMLKIANSIYESQDDIPEVLVALDEFVERNTPAEVETLPLQPELEVRMFIDIPEEDGFEKENVLSALMHAKGVSTVPTIREVVLMPDACPAGGVLGTIPVGCVAVAEDAIHPGMHSADICCSMFLTSLNTLASHWHIDEVMDVVQEVTHFGVGGRKDYPLGHHHYILERAQNNRFLASVQMLKAMSDHHMTQGDGNHFFYVGEKESTGELTLVTHHGSRSPGALLYKEGMRVAEQFRQELSPDTPKHNAWIPANTDEGQWYWEALQIIREWTKYNHQSLHDEVIQRLTGGRSYADRFWNEHNFVFKRDNLYYHAKGSTPVFGNYAYDADYMGRTIVPLNMGEPILIITDHLENDFGFAPHGAGRNMSRTAFMKQNAGKTVEQIMKEQVGHIDARFYTGKPDASELPGAYKNAEEVQRQIRDYKLANVVDRVLPMGSIMAGEFDKPWRKK